jgi:predicted DNA-binding ribbon-helix-helix protein
MKSKRPREIARQKSQIIKRSIVIDGHKTSVSLEGPFWTALQEITKAQSVRASKLIAKIDRARNHANLSSAIRQYVLDYYRRLASK